VFGRKPKGKSQIGRPCRKWEANIKMGILIYFVNSILYNFNQYILKHFNTLTEYTVGKLLRNDMVISYI
jgi:hypothetical protein